MKQYLILFVSMFCFSSGFADDISTVKLAYEKLATFNQATRAEFDAQGKIVQSKTNDFSYELRNFRVGPFRDVAYQPVGTLITKPAGKKLSVVRHILSHHNGPEHVMYEMRWDDVPYGSSMTEDWENTNLGQVMVLAGQSMPESYVSYEVVVRLAGQQRNYKAIALRFGVQAETQSAFSIWDNILSVDTINTALTEFRRAVKSPWRRYVLSRAYQEYAEAFEKAGRNYEQAEMLLRKSGKFQNDESQNEVALKEDPPYLPECTSAVEYGIEVQKNAEGTDSHQLGKHYANSGLKGVCFKDASTCEMACSVDTTYWNADDYGLTFNGCHAVKKDIKYDSKTGRQGRTLDCGATVGAAFKACYFCYCNVTLSISGFGVTATATSDGFWTYMNTLVHHCC